MPRGIVIVFVLVAACGSPAAPPTPDAPIDAGSFRQCGPGGPPSAYPCCFFVTDAAANPNQCSPSTCVGANSKCDCDAGYSCAAICPSPLGGCGGSPICCRLP